MTARTLAIRAANAAALVGILTFGAGRLTPDALAADAQWQPIDAIRTAAREAVLKSIPHDARATVEAVAVDERLKMPACARPLDARIEREVRNGQGTVAVACAAPAWRLFVPVRVVREVQVVVARRALAAGAVIAADDLEVRTQSSTSLPLDYLGDVEQAIGFTVRRAVPPGTLLAAAALEYPAAIERGALVTLVAGRGAVQVRSEGVALEAARLKDRVRVKTASGRIVEGVVEASGEVRVGT